MLLSDKYPFLTNYFTEAINHKERSLAQCLLFYGNDLESQYTLANEIARLLNCKSDKTDDCECLNCKWIRENSHPAVMTISRLDNKQEDDDSKTVISIKQSNMIKEKLVTDSEFHRVFIFCDRDDEGNITGLNPTNFQAEVANSLLKVIEEPQAGITFIFLTRYIEDMLETIVSRAQCFFVPSYETPDFKYNSILPLFENYWDFNREEVFEVSQKLLDLSKEIQPLKILEETQNYIFSVLKNNPHHVFFIQHLKIIEAAKTQIKLGIKLTNVFDDMCLKLIR